MPAKATMERVKDVLQIVVIATALSGAVGAAYVAKANLASAQESLTKLETKHERDVREIKETLHGLDKKQAVIEYETRQQTEMLKEIQQDLKRR